MLIIDGEDEKKLLSHLKVLKLHYRTEMQKYWGLPMYREYAICIENLQSFIVRIGGAEPEKDEN